MSEGRLRERHEFGKHILCYRCDSSTHIKVPFVFEINDISYSGLGIHANVLLSPDSIMYFRIDTLDMKREFRVQVKWCKYNGAIYVAGVQFMDVKKEDIIFLHEIIKRL